MRCCGLRGHVGARANGCGSTCTWACPAPRAAAQRVGSRRWGVALRAESCESTPQQGSLTNAHPPALCREHQGGTATSTLPFQGWGLGERQHRGIFGEPAHRRHIFLPFIKRHSSACLQVREGPGSDGLVLFHADEPAGPGTARVTRTSFAEELRTGRHRLAVVRRLHKRLSPAHADLVHQFATLNLGKTAPIPPHPASILQANTAGMTTTAYERLSCSDFVATMLQVAGVVERTGETRDYGATNSRGHVVGPPLNLTQRTTSTRAGSGGSALPASADSGGGSGPLSGRASGNTDSTASSNVSKAAESSGEVGLPRSQAGAPSSSAAGGGGQGGYRVAASLGQEKALLPAAALQRPGSSDKGGSRGLLPSTPPRPRQPPNGAPLVTAS